MLELIEYKNYKIIDCINIELFNINICPICGNTKRNSKYISELKSNVYICQECYINEGIIKLYLNCPQKVHIRFLKLNITRRSIPTSPLQKKVYKKCLNTSKNILIDAVCGSGKSNIILKIILALHTKKKILFICPRRKLVEDFYTTFVTVFKIKPTIITGEEKSDFFSNITLCTSKMLYRIPPVFNLLIFDEVDAFPYYGSNYAQDVLKNYVRKTKARVIMLTATPDNKYSVNTKRVKLKKRYHGYPLPVPRVMKSDLSSLLKYINKKINSGENVLLFCANISVQFELYRYFIVRLKCFMLNSKIKKSRQEKILEIFESAPSLMITTTLLERGVTYEKVTAIVYQADSNIFDYRVLIQISGRVNRIANYQQGEVLFISDIKNIHMKRAIKIIKKNNRGK
jgi:competence protein ComFA